MGKKDGGNDSNRRNESIEALRIVAAFAIVLFHSGAPGHDLAYSGLIVFLLLSPGLDCMFNWERVRSPALLAKTFIIPWLFWMIVYGALNFLRGLPLLAGHGSPFGIFYGTAPHLWFMPAMFAVLAALNILKPRMSPGMLFWLATLGAAALLTTASLWRPPSTGWSEPLGQWMQAAPIVLVGIALGLGGKVPRWAAIAGGSSLAISLAIVGAAALPGVSIPYVLGTLVTVPVLWFGPRSIGGAGIIRQISACMLGVYLSHIFLLSVVSRITGHGNYLTAILAFSCALAIVWIAQRIVPMSQFVIGPAIPGRRLAPVTRSRVLWRGT